MVDLIIPNLIKIDQNSLLVSTGSATFAEKRWWRRNGLRRSRCSKFWKVNQTLNNNIVITLVVYYVQLIGSSIRQRKTSMGIPQIGMTIRGTLNPSFWKNMQENGGWGKDKKLTPGRPFESFFKIWNLQNKYVSLHREYST